MTIARQFSILIATALVLVVVFAVGLTRQFANLSSEGARLIGNREKIALLNRQLASGNSQQTERLRRQLDTLDPSFPETAAEFNYRLGDMYVEYLKLDIDDQERMTVERIRMLQAELSQVFMQVYDALRSHDREEANARLGRLYQLEGEVRDEFEKLDGVQTAKLREVVDHLNRSASRGVVEATLLLAALVVVLGAGTVGLRRRILGPARAILRACDRIRLGDLCARVPAARDDEFGRLIRGFNFMAESLAESQVDLEQKVLERTRELQEAQKHLLQAEKMSAMGLLVSGVAHELNNPLASIMGAVELAKLEAAARPDGDALARLATVDAEVERCRRIVLNLLQFARRQEPHLGVVSLNDVVDQVLALREYEMTTRNVAIVREFDPARPVLCADHGAIQQVVLNLLNNAHDAICETGRPGTIRVRTRGEASQVTLELLDDGPGFSDPGRAFDPFYTTKEVGKGTGLGLSVCYGIVREHRGEIAVGNWEHGARVTVSLPVGDVTGTASSRTADGMAGGERTATAAPGRASGLCALVVDDEEALVRLQVSFLQRLGISAAGAASGEAAIRHLQDHHVDLVISDVRMPGQVDGVALFRWVETHRPGLSQRFVFTSGDVVGLNLDESIEAAGALRIDKPFRYEAYARTIRRALELDEVRA